MIEALSEERLKEFESLLKNIYQRLAAVITNTTVNLSLTTLHHERSL